MKRILHLIVAMSCFSAVSRAQTFPVKPIIVNGPDTNRVNIVMLPDGFTNTQMGKFDTAVAGIMAYLFNEIPYRQYARFFNAYCIEVPSVDSGADHPGTATDVVEPIIPIANVNTYFNSTFDNGGVHRAIYATNTAGVSSVLNNNFPMYDVPFVLVNSPEYGGTGGWYITATLDASANETAVHEMGHTFGKLWDEYWNGMPGEHPNMTQESNPALNRWSNWLNVSGMGIFPYGSSNPQSTWFRPHQNCKMQFLNRPLCSVCRENIIDQIYKTVRPIDAFSPANDALVYSFAGAPINFSFTPIRPNPSSLKFQWELNGSMLGSTDTAVLIDDSQLKTGSNKLVAYITDTTLLSRSYQPAKGYVFSIEWELQKGWKTSVSKVTADNKFVYRFYPLPAHNSINLDIDNNTGASQLDYKIVAINGAVVKQGTRPLQQGSQTMTLDISGLAPGIYTCQLNGEGILAASQLVIE